MASLEFARWRAGFQAVLSLAVFLLVLLAIDEEILLARISGLDPFWLAVALAATVPQYFLSASRWRLTAERLGIGLPFRTALAEYYLAVLTNQILPGGVLGDAARAVRHGMRISRGDRNTRYGPAIRAVVYERASGQFVLFIVMLAGLFFWPSAGTAKTTMGLVSATFLAVILAGAVFLTITNGRRSRSLVGMRTNALLSEIHHVLFAPAVVFRQTFYSLAVLASYLFCFYCAARAVGIAMGFDEVVSFVPAILFSMTIPVTIGGWGIREATAASIWGLANLTPADGVAVSVTYGIIVLLSALPGIFFVFVDSKRDVGDQR